MQFSESIEFYLWQVLFVITLNFEVISKLICTWPAGLFDLQMSVNLSSPVSELSQTGENKNIKNAFPESFFSRMLTIS